MITNRFLVSTVMLISLSALGLCQSQDEDNDITHERYLSTLPPLPDDWKQTPGITDQKSKTPILFGIISTSSPLTSKGEPKATSDSRVSATTQSLEPEPSEEPELEKADFKYPDNGEVCVRACLKAVFEVSYTAQDDDGKETQKTARIPLPQKADVGGSCGSKENPNQFLMLQWADDKYLLKIQFEKTRSGDTDNWIATQVEFSYDTRDTTYFENAVDAGRQWVRVEPDSEFFESPWKKSYVCKTEDTINMTSSSSDKTDQSVLRIEEIQIQPFMQPKANGTFSEGEPCESDRQVKPPTSNVASVAVGATLGCLILIVIIVYAVGRRMGSITDRTGYKAVE